jgi:hypothetical protein
MIAILILSVVVTFIVMIYSFTSSVYVDGASSFVNQQYLDQIDDWVLLRSHTGNFSILNPDGSVTKLPSETNEVNCKIGGYPDIKGVSYNSNGETIYATLWVNPMTMNKNSSYDGVVNEWIAGGYQMPIDIPSTYDFGTDYAYRLEWDPVNKTWLNSLEERNLGFGGKNRIYTLPAGIEDFVDSEGNYVQFSINRSTLGFPDRFKMIFSTWGAFQNDEGRLCAITDTTSFMDIPPPVFNLSISDLPSYIRKGESVVVPIHITSDSGNNAIAKLKAAYNNDSISLRITPEKVNIRPYSVADSLLEIKALDTGSPAQVVINASVSFPSSPILQSGAIISTPSVNNISDEVRFTLGILPELGLFDYVNNTLSTWGAAASQALALVVGLGGAATAASLFISKLRGRNQSDGGENIKS